VKDQVFFNASYICYPIAILKLLHQYSY